MKTFILSPIGKGESITVKGFDSILSVLGTSMFFARKAFFDGTPCNGYFVDEALTDEFGVPLENLKAETDALCRIYINKKGKKLEKYLEKRKEMSAPTAARCVGCPYNTERILWEDRS